MKNWKEKASELGQWVQKNRLVQWFQGQDVSIRYLIRFILLALVIIAWNIINIHFNSFRIDDTSAQYLLSALVQSLAAIIAIVVTMTLVAVQLAASAYSPRVIDVFKENKIMWWLLVWYGLSIFFGLFILEMIGGKYQSLSHWGVSLEYCVFLVYLMGIVAFVGLFFHIGNMIDLLKPEKIIRRLSEKITGEKVLNHIISVAENKKDKTKPIEKDPVQPIVDIIHGAVMKYDIATTRYGLKAITEKAIEVVRSGCLFSWDDVPGNNSKKLLEYLRDKFGIDWAKLEDICKSDEKTITISEGGNSVKITLDGDKENATEATLKIISDGIIHDLKVRKENGKLNIYSSDCEKETSKHFCAHLERIGKLTVGREDDEAVIKVLESLESFGRSTAEKEFGDAAREAARAIRSVGTASAKKGLGSAAWQAARSLGDVGTASAKKGLGGAVKAARSLGDVGIICCRKGLGGAAKEAAKSLGGVGKASAEKELGNVASAAAKSLGGVGVAAAEKDLISVVWKVTKSLGEIGMAAAGKRFENATLEVVNSLGAVGVAVAERGIIDVAFHIVESLGQVGMAAAENELTDAAQQAAKCLAHIGKITAEGGGEFEAVTIQAIESIGDIGKQGGAAFYTSYLMRVGETTVKQKLKNETWTVVKSIGQIGMAVVEKRDDVAENVITSLDSYLNTIKRSAGGGELVEWEIIKTAAQFLIKLGVFAIERNLDDAAQKHAKCFVKWTRPYGKWDVHDLFIDGLATSGRHKSSRKFEVICEELRTQTPHNTPQH